MNHTMRPGDQGATGGCPHGRAAMDGSICGHIVMITVSGWRGEPAAGPAGHAVPDRLGDQDIHRDRGDAPGRGPEGRAGCAGAAVRARTRAGGRAGRGSDHRAQPAQPHLGPGPGGHRRLRRRGRHTGSLRIRAGRAAAGRAAGRPALLQPGGIQPSRADRGEGHRADLREGGRLAGLRPGRPVRQLLRPRRHHDQAVRCAPPTGTRSRCRSTRRAPGRWPAATRTR